MGGDAYPDRDHWGDRAFREDLCGVINGLWFFRSLATRFQRLRLDLGGLVRCRNENVSFFNYILWKIMVCCCISMIRCWLERGLMGLL